MELLQLKYFCTVAKFENITRAAAEHMIPQPAMSKTISKLERELQVKLFDRRGNRLVLTDTGKRFYQYLERGLFLISDAVKMAQDQEHAESTEIRLLLNTNRNIVLKFISDFTKRNSCANFFIDHNQNIESAVHEPPHLCISASPIRPEYDKSVPLLKERLLIAVYRNHRFAQYSEIPLDELSQERFILLSARFRMHRLFIEYCNANGMNPNVCMYCSDPSYVRYAVEQELGISAMPEYSWGDVIGDNTVLVPLKEETIYQTHRILWDSTRYVPKMVKLFRNELIEHYRERFS